MSVYFQPPFERGFGTFPLSGETLHRAVLAACDTGYRAFDTAQMYGNEADTGAALKAAGLPREELLITTKVDVANFDPGRFLPSVEASLEALQVDCIDVLLLHWPTPGGDIAASLHQLEAAHREGLCRHVGLSNYTAAMMRTARDRLAVPIATNQVEFHPLLNQDTLLAAAAETGIPLSAYCSVARGKVFEFPLFAEIGAAHGKRAAQVVLRWILQKGVSLNTMSTNPDNIRANFDIMDFSLSAQEMARIDAETAANHRIVNQALVPFAPDFD